MKNGLVVGSGHTLYIWEVSVNIKSVVVLLWADVQELINFRYAECISEDIMPLISSQIYATCWVCRLMPFLPIMH